MESLYSVKLGKLIREFRLEVLRGAAGYEDRPIRTENVNRPGLQLTGFFDYFDPDRLQVIGRVEDTFLSGLTAEQRNIYYSTNVPLERVVVEQLVKGPAQAGHYAVLPPELKILSVTVSEGICYVNFDETFVNPPLDIEPEITIYAIANSLAETCHVSRVQFSVNGKSDVMFRDAMSLDRLYEENTRLILEE